jgi:radical SAM superfamily enzyme YgiQ (UPF0313 family)
MDNIFGVTDVFDVLAYGEGEETVNFLADYVEGKANLAEIPNLIFKSNGSVVTTATKRIKDLNEINFPCYDDDVYLAMKDNQKIRVVLLDESRGCPNCCNFCIHPLKSGKKRRTMNAKIFVDRIEKMTRKYDMPAFRFAGSNPPAGLRKEIAEEIVRRKLDVRYSAFAHVREASYEDFKILRKSGCCALAFGVESGSQRILDQIVNKKVTVEQVKKALKDCKRSGIETIASLIVPAPSETETTKNETMRLLLETRPHAVNVFFPTLLPGTEWERNREMYHFEIKDMESYYRCAMYFRIDPFGSLPSLWRPLPDYSMDGKTFSEVAEETSRFIKVVNYQGMTTQIYDQVFLLAGFVAMSPQELKSKTASLISRGACNELEKIVAEINRNVCELASHAHSRN